MNEAKLIEAYNKMDGARGVLTEAMREMRCTGSQAYQKSCQLQDEASALFREAEKEEVKP